MNANALIDEKSIISEALQAMQSREPTLPRAAVKRFLGLIGEEIKRTGALHQEYVDGLLKRLHDGEF